MEPIVLLINAFCLQKMDTTGFDDERDTERGRIVILDKVKQLDQGFDLVSVLILVLSSGNQLDLFRLI